MKTKTLIGILGTIFLCASFTSTFAQQHKHHQSVQKQRHQKVHRHNPHHRYSKLPRWGKSYTVAPKKAAIIAHKGINYHFHSGIFYRPLAANFIIAPAPIGVRIHTLPKKKIKFLHSGKEYFYYYGTYYAKTDVDNEYITVAPPKGARVDALPEGYEQVEINGNEYYKFEGTYYKAITTENNEEWYEVVGESL